MYIYGSTEQFHHLCNIISSTEAPGIESSGSKGNSHHAQIKVSSMISQHEHFSVNHFLSAGGNSLHHRKEKSFHAQRRLSLWLEAMAEVMAPIVNKSTLSLWSSPGKDTVGKIGKSEAHIFSGACPRAMKSLYTLLRVLEQIYPEYTEKATFSAAGYLLWPEK